LRQDYLDRENKIPLTTSMTQMRMLGENVINYRNALVGSIRQFLIGEGYE